MSWEGRKVLLAEGEASGVDVHLGEAQVFEGGGQGEGGLHGDVAQQVGLLAALLQLVGGVVQHLLVPVADLLHLQPVDLPPQADELTGQAVVLDLHLPQLFSQELQRIIDGVKPAEVAHSQVRLFGLGEVLLGSFGVCGVCVICGVSLPPVAALHALLPLQVGRPARLQLQLLRQSLDVVQVLRVPLRGLVSSCRLPKVHPA